MYKKTIFVNAMNNLCKSFMQDKDGFYVENENKKSNSISDMRVHVMHGYVRYMVQPGK